ncbi:MAG: CvpA family protein [Clostridia bacterium]|nr:CvpA family protein [Clostridia bacterium]
MGIVLDLILVAVVVVVVIIAAKKGIISTVAGILAFALAIFLAAQTAKPVAQVMYTGFFHKTVQKELYKVVPENSTATLAEKSQYVLDCMPDFARKQAEKVGINVAAISNQIQQTKLDNSKLYESLEEKIVQPIAVEVLKHVLFFFLAVIYGILLRLLFGAIAAGMKQSDTVSKADAGIGAVLGIIEGAVIVFLLCTLLTYIQPRIENQQMRQAISDSKIVTVLDKFDPMEAISMAQAFAEK